MYYFSVKAKISVDFQVSTTVPLNTFWDILLWKKRKQSHVVGMHGSENMKMGHWILQI